MYSAKHLLPDVEMNRIFRPMMENLGDEVADIEAEHSGLAHRVVAPRRCVEVTVVSQMDIADARQPPAKIGVLAVKFDRGVEAADAVESTATHGEIAAVEHHADAQHVLHENVRRRTEREVIGAQ